MTEDRVRIHRQQTRRIYSEVYPGLNKAEKVTLLAVLVGVTLVALRFGWGWLLVLIPIAIVAVKHAARLEEVFVDRPITEDERREGAAKESNYELRRLTVLDRMPYPSIVSPWCTVGEWSLVDDRFLELPLTGTANGRTITETVRVIYRDHVSYENDVPIQSAVDEAKDAIQTALGKLRRELVILE
jgi:hypothetical protein